MKLTVWFIALTLEVQCIWKCAAIGYVLGGLLYWLANYPRETKVKKSDVDLVRL